MFGLAIFLAGTAGASADDASASPTELYVQTFTAMAALPKPAYVSYRLVTAGNVNMHVELIRSRGYVWFGFSAGARASDLRIFHRNSDARSVIFDDAGERYVTSRAFFDPTWAGSYNAIRDGMYFWQEAAQPGVSGVPTPMPSPTPPPGLTTIAFEATATSVFYTISDGGVAHCNNGDPGRALQLKARRDPHRYQLTYAIVDTANHLFCALRFNTDTDASRSYLTDLEFYGWVDGYWARTGGVFESVDHNMQMIPVDVAGPYGATTQYHPHYYTTDVKLPYDFVEMRFPGNEDEGLFSPPS